MQNSTQQPADYQWKPVSENEPSRPLRWRKSRMVRLADDLFHEDVPLEFIDRVFAVMTLCPQHTFQVLSKRPERMAEYFAGEPWRRLIEDGISDQVAALRPDTALQWHVRKIEASEPDGSLKWPLPNVWLGTSVEDQPRADERIPHLLRCPATVRFLSCEPLLGEVDLSAFFGGPYVGLPGDKVHDNYNFGIHWVITGGESGPNARACNVEWIRSIVRRCKAASVPCFVKQLGAWPVEFGHGEPTLPMAWKWDDGGENVERWYKPADKKGGDPSEWSEDLRVREMPEVRT